jgi:hypothetical protein
MLRRLKAVLAGRVAQVALWVALLTLTADALVEALGVRFCQPIGHEPTTAAWAYQTGARDPDVVFIGSSQVHYGFVPAEAEGAFREAAGRPLRAWCLGIEAGIVAAYEPLVRDLLVGPAAPRLLLVGVGPRDVNSNSSRSRLATTYYAGPSDWGREVREEGLRADWRGLAAGIFGRPTALLQWGLVSAGYRAKNYRSIIRDQGGAHEPLAAGETPDALPGGPSAERWQAMAEARLRMTEEDLLRDFATAGRAERALAGLVRAAKGRGVRVVLVNMPTHPEYDAATPPAVRDAYREAMDRACRELGVTFIDLAVPPYRDGDRDLWRDLDHMNRRGAVRFSRLVGREVLPGLLPPE